MPLEDRIGRREFLAVGIAAGATLGSSLLSVGCKGDPVDPYIPPDPVIPPDTTILPTPDPVVAEITGHTELQIRELGGRVIGRYDSSSSTGPINSRAWTMKKDVDPFDERRTEDLGGEVTARADFVRPGTYTVKVEVKGPDSSSSKELQTTVGAPELPGEDYPLIALIGHAGEDQHHTLYLLNYSARTPARRIAGHSRLVGQTITWERTGERLATDFSRSRSNISVIVYNLLTDELVTISRGRRLWEPSWNPRKDWIAAAEAGRAGYSEPVLVRPDGSEAIYLAGDTPSTEVAGSYPTWDPEGERLMLAESSFDFGDDLWGPYRRAAIYEGFWDGGTPTRTQMPTEDQIKAFLDSRGDLNATNMRSIRVGLGGVSISPSGREAVYRFEYGYDSNSQRMIAKSSLDGTGDIEMLVSHRSIDSLFSPIWSPDERFILFTGTPPGQENTRAYKVPSGGGTPSRITSLDFDVSTVAWYQ